ncbi:MAG TPA: NADH-quinone oxidoreductase subunit M [Sandaracinaceae bacterium LLY-WYZ-13_1]|nr:NADH-quinone oxidoreductase subunit M [Sandaracinaceae bacterium LLY-WYZ-13_1]
MTDVLTTLLVWPLPWVLLTLFVGRLFPKVGPLGHVFAMGGAVVLSTVFFGAPDPDGILSALLAWPALGAIIALFLPRQWGGGVRTYASVWLWAGFVLSLYLLGPVVREALAPTPEAFAEASPIARFFYSHVALPFFGEFATDPSFGFAQAGYQLVEDTPWIESFGIHYKVGIDGISLWLILLTTLLTPLALDVSWNSVNTKVKEFAFAFLLLEVGMLGAFVALDLFLFYVFWELMLVPMYLIIGVWGGKDRVYAAVKFFIYTMIGSLLMLVAILYVVMQYRYAPENAAEVITFDLERISFLMLPRTEQLVLFFAFALAFAIKVPMFPFHTWLPDAHVQAPTGGSVILAAVLLKLGGYGFIRFAMPLFPWASRYVAPSLAVFAIIGIIYGAYCAWVQRDVKKLVAYSSVSHLGFVMLGLFSMTEGGVSGGILQMVSHGISTGALFILVGVVYDRRHTRDLADFGGLAKVMPAYATLFVIVAMSSVGLPGTNGFVGEFMVLSGTFVSQTFNVYQKVFTLFAATGVILAAIYMLHAVLKTFWGPVTHEENEKLEDLSGREKWILAPLIVLIFWIGVVPGFFLNPMEASVERFMSTWNARAIVAFQDDRLRILPGGLPEEGEEAEPAPADEAEEQEEAEAARAPADGESDPHAANLARDADGRLARLGGTR